MKRTRLKKWLYIGGPIVVIALIAIIILSKWSSGPAEGTISTHQPTTVKQLAAPTEPLAISSVLFTTTIPGDFALKDASPPTEQTPVRILALSRQTRQQVGFTGGTLPTEGLSGLADYNLRVKDTATYTRSNATSLPTGSVAFTDAAGSMITLFWQHGGNYAEITVSGDAGTEKDLYVLLSKIQQNWQWK